MSMATDITLLLILIQASIGFVDSIGMFDEHYLEVPSNNASYTISDLDAFGGVTGTEPTWTDEIVLYAQWAWEAFFIGLKIVFTVLFVFPTLVIKFNIPVALSIFIQAGIYYVYGTWYAQYKSKVGWKAYE